MTGQQQLDVMGACAYEDHGKVVIAIRDPLGNDTGIALDPYVARRFALYVARSYHDAIRVGRRAGRSAIK